MAAFGAWLEAASPSHASAFDAHWRLTAIHPLGDGNDRTARLLMNLLLLRGGYPPVAVRPEDRLAYLAALETGSTTGDRAPFGDLPFGDLMTARLVDTLGAYIAVLKESVK
jgi:Fic family protein